MNLLRRLCLRLLPLVLVPDIVLLLTLAKVLDFVLCGAIHFRKEPPFIKVFEA